jgi:inorganic pyrophosphatase
MNAEHKTHPVLIEIPKGTENKKFEYNHGTKEMVLDFVFENLTWPFNYGEVVGTLGGDGDALDANVFSTDPLEQGSVVECVPFGIVYMVDRGETDNKLLFIPANDALVERYIGMESLAEQEKEDLKKFYAEIARQKKKVIEISGFGNKQAAEEEIKKSLK